MKRFASLSFGLCSALVFAGCPGSLSNPDDFVDGGTIPKTAETVLAESCGVVGCHDDSPDPEAGLDLLSPNVENRVVNVSATGEGCESDILVVAGDADGSYLLDKVLDIGICGVQMPVLDALSETDTDILRQWINDMGGSDGGTPDGG